MNFVVVQSRTSRRAISLKSVCRGTRADARSDFCCSCTQEPTTTFHSFGSGRSLPSQVPHCDKIVRASRGVSPPSPFLRFRRLLSFFLNRSPSPFQRVPSVILSGCITYRTIECPDHDLGTRAAIPSNHSIILSPCNAPWCTAARKPNWPAFKKGYKPSLTFSLCPAFFLPLSFSSVFSPYLTWLSRCPALRKNASIYEFRRI